MDRTWRGRERTKIKQIITVRIIFGLWHYAAIAAVCLLYRKSFLSIVTGTREKTNPGTHDNSLVVEVFFHPKVISEKKFFHFRLEYGRVSNISSHLPTCALGSFIFVHFAPCMCVFSKWWETKYGNSHGSFLSNPYSRAPCANKKRTILNCYY